MATLFVVLFIISLLPISLAGLGVYYRKRQFGLVDNNHPRLQQAKLSGVGFRVISAEKNAWEALSFYTVMCVLAYVSSIDLADFAYPAILFLLTRIAHPIFYIFDLAFFRSAVFFIGWFCCLYIGLKALTGIA